MPAPFKQIQRAEFAALLERFDFRRHVNAVHMHHTWRPSHADYDPANGHRTIMGMYLYHTQQNGWQDIAQHITIAPDGSIWLGRNWNLPPASAAGHNGNLQAGPFMFEIIGNFDRGFDKLEGAQLATVIEVTARVERRFGLGPASLQFHNTMSKKSCPGTGVDYATVLAAVSAFQVPAPAAARGVGAGAAIEELIRSLGDGSRYTDPADAELDHDHDHDREASGERGIARRELPPDVVTELKPHLVNLNFGKFSNGGDWKTVPADVDALFDVHLETALGEARAGGLPLRIVFFAHGGLVKESLGLAIARKHLQFWKKNGIYPINFVWETGLFETLGQLLQSSRGGTRGLFTDAFLDPIIESAARLLGGPKIWGGMKLSAERSVEPTGSAHGEGGAYYVAQKLKAFCDLHSEAGQTPIELHAVGHSAGSIFHANFLASALELGVPKFHSLQLLAPAITVDAFKARLLARLGSGIDVTTIFTMTDQFERKDTCDGVYHKSLLYLIYHSLEPEAEREILGLERSLRADAQLAAKFGLNGQPNSNEVVFSVTPSKAGRSASTSTSHGGFDDDPPTMGSVARRILGKKDQDAIEEYQSPTAARSLARSIAPQDDRGAKVAELNAALETALRIAREL